MVQEKFEAAAESNFIDRLPFLRKSRKDLHFKTF